MGQPTLILTQSDLRRLVGRADYLRAVEDGFQASADGRIEAPTPLHIEGKSGGLHGKGALLRGERSYAVVKVNSNFPANADSGELPTIQGALFLFDGSNGALLAIMDSIELTIMRTAAATALAAKHLARTDARTLTICGCGAQARAQAAALADVRKFDRGFAWDVDRDRALTFAKAMGDEIGFHFELPDSLSDATRQSDIIATCTTSREPFLDERHVKAGAFIAAVGADSASKSEIHPALIGSASVFADVTSQALVMGDSLHAVAAGTMSPADIRGDLADLVSGRVAGRSSDAEIIVFDSTGTAIEDVASAAIAYERAVNSDVRRVEFADA